MSRGRFQSRSRGAPGLTLVEIMVATAILATITAMIWVSFDQGARAVRAVEHSQDRYHEAEVALSVISRDLASAYLTKHVNPAEPVAEYVWNYGEKLRRGIHTLCDRIGIRAECKGPPFRMALIFEEPDVERLHMKQALIHQELLKEGVTTYNGVMLPSYAHDEPVLERTLTAMGNALEVVATADRRNEIERYLEIPPLLF